MANNYPAVIPLAIANGQSEVRKKVDIVDERWLTSGGFQLKASREMKKLTKLATQEYNFCHIKCGTGW